MASISLLTANSMKKGSRAFGKTSQYIAAIFQSLKLQLLWQTTKWRHPHETKKTAIYNSRMAALLHIAPHIIPVATTLVFLVANIVTMSIGSISTNALVTFQFAAKLVEILIQASIATIVLAFVRNQLLGREGFPLGGLLAPFTTTDISSLWSLHLWGCLTSSNVDTALRVATYIFLPSAVVLAALVGPSIAVLMIPRPINHLTLSTLEFHVLNDLYPRNVDLIGGRLRAESDFNATSFQVQLRTGFNWLLPVVDEYGARNAKYVSSIKQEIVHGVLYEASETLATMPTALSVSSIWEAVANNIWTVRVLQPYIYTSCWSSSVLFDGTDTSKRYIDFGPAKPYLENVVSYETLLHTSNVTTTDNLVSFYRAYDTCGRDINFCGSIMWAKPPLQVTNHSLIMVEAQMVADGKEWSLSSCTIDAYWATVNTRMSTELAFTNDMPANEKEDLRKVLYGLGDRTLVSVTPAWAQRAYTVTMELYREAGDDDSDRVPFQALQYVNALSYVASARYTEGTHEYGLPSKHWRPKYTDQDMSQQQWTMLVDYIDANKLQRHFDSVDVVADNTAWSSLDDLTKLEIRIFATGYGYDLSETTVKLSLAVIMFYFAAVLGYLLYTIITGTVASSWDSVAELVILAINSQRPVGLLKNTSVGVDTLSTYCQSVSIRVNHHDSLELVLDSTGQAANYTEVLANEKY